MTNEPLCLEMNLGDDGVYRTTGKAVPAYQPTPNEPAHARYVEFYSVRPIAHNTTSHAPRTRTTESLPIRPRTREINPAVTWVMQFNKESGREHLNDFWQDKIYMETVE